MISQRSAVAAFYLLIVLLAAGIPNLAPRQITSPTNSAFRLPVLPGVTVAVTQGNNQDDHIAMYGSEYAFDFIVGQQNFVIAAAQGGTVIGVNDSSTIQCSGMNTEIAPESKPLKHCWAYANFVLIADDDGTTAALYVHLLPYANNASMLKVTLGEHVNQGEPLGLAGTTGYSSGVHLHFQVETLPSAAAQKSQQPLGWWWTNSLPISFSNPEIMAKDACLHIASNGVPQTGQCFVVTKLTGVPSPTSTPSSSGYISLSADQTNVPVGTTVTLTAQINGSLPADNHVSINISAGSMVIQLCTDVLTCTVQWSSSTPQTIVFQAGAYRTSFPPAMSNTVSVTWSGISTLLHLVANPTLFHVCDTFVNPSCPTDCPGIGETNPPPSDCIVTISSPASNQTNINWSVSTDNPNLVSIPPPSSGTLSPGQQSILNLLITTHPCAGGSVTISGGDKPVIVQWVCS